MNECEPGGGSVLASLQGALEVSGDPKLAGFLHGIEAFRSQLHFPGLFEGILGSGLPVVAKLQSELQSYVGSQETQARRV
jgi:hypothetical protein